MHVHMWWLSYWLYPTKARNQDTYLSNLMNRPADLDLSLAYHEILLILLDPTSQARKLETFRTERETEQSCWPALVGKVGFDVLRWGIELW